MAGSRSCAQTRAIFTKFVADGDATLAVLGQTSADQTFREFLFQNASLLEKLKIPRTANPGLAAIQGVQCYEPVIDRDLFTNGNEHNASAWDRPPINDMTAP